MSDRQNYPIDDLETQHFKKTIAVFKYYKTYAFKYLNNSEQYFKQLPQSQQSLVPNFLGSIEEIKECINQNFKIICKILEYADPEMFDNVGNQDISINNVSDKHDDLNSSKKSSEATRLCITSNDVDKVRSTLKQFVRDWSIEGQVERDIAYKPVIDEILRLYPKNRNSKKILVPGAGLGRLAWEIAQKGFNCQGNEWSLYMLFSSFFILNNCRTPNAHTLHPWVSQFCNNMSRADQLKAIQFPDVDPSQIPSDVAFSMTAGDFLDVYTEPKSWDCICTVFFIDTAHNILAYLETIWNILVPGGYWINIGPLLYHFSEVPGESSLELTYEELREAIVKIGFEIKEERKNLKCGYTQNPASMLAYQYYCVYFLAYKPLESGSDSNSVTGQGDS